MAILAPSAFPLASAGHSLVCLLAGGGFIGAISSNSITKLIGP